MRVLAWIWQKFVEWVAPHDPSVGERLTIYLESRCSRNYRPQLCEVSEADYTALLEELYSSGSAALIEDCALCFRGTWVVVNPDLRPNHWRIVL
jgi:hypothetical protein